MMENSESVVDGSPQDSDGKGHLDGEPKSWFLVSGVLLVSCVTQACHLIFSDMLSSSTKRVTPVLLTLWTCKDSGMMK